MSASVVQIVNEIDAICKDLSLSVGERLMRLEALRFRHPVRDLLEAYGLANVAAQAELAFARKDPEEARR